MPPKQAKTTGTAKEEDKIPSRNKRDDGNPEAKEDAEMENNDAEEEAEVEAEPEDIVENSNDPNDTQSSPNKAPRKSHNVPPKQLLTFLLSSSALPYCNPAEELEAAEASEAYKSSSLTSPTSFTSFEHLLCSHLLSKPLSHVLGMRSIRTILNEPFNLSTPEAIVKAGEHRVWEAMEAARTRHRQKTVSYIFGMAESYADSETMFALAEEANNDGPKGVIEHIKATVPGLGLVGAEIFCRRIQCVDGWGDALWPYADGKSMDALREIGIEVNDAEELQTAIERDVDWDKVGDMGLHERDLSNTQLVGEQEETQAQAEFVVVLERAVGCVLEGKVEDLKEAAAEMEGCSIQLRSKNRAQS